MSFTCLNLRSKNLRRFKKVHQMFSNTPYLRSRSLGWFLLSRFLSMRSDRSCFRTPVAYSISPCRALMMRDATFPRSRMENERWASSVRMNVSRKCFLFKSWPNRVRAFSTFAGTWERWRNTWSLHVFSLIGYLSDLLKRFHLLLAT